MLRRLFTIFIILSFSNILTYAYDYVPTIKSFNKKAYGGGRQNWSIGVDSKGIVYFGNSDGLLRYIYGSWELCHTSNKDLVRSLCINNDTIWCAGDSDFGFFTKDSPGNLNYHFIYKVIGGSAWNIECVDNCVYYQSEKNIVIYNVDSKKINNIFSDIGFAAITKKDNKILAFLRDGTLGMIKNNDFVKIKVIKELKDVEVRKLFVFNDYLYALLFNGRIINLSNNTELKLSPEIKNNAFFTVCPLGNSKLLLGTISRGLFVMDAKSGNSILNVNSQKGLIDNTVLCIGADLNDNVWLGLDYGITYVNMQNPIKSIFQGGATYSIVNNKNSTYLATNKGIYYSQNNSNFKLIKDSDGQAWNLRSINSKIYACHNKGVFEIKGNVIYSVFSYDGVMDIANFGNSDYFLLSAYSGLFLAKYINGKIKLVENLNVWNNPKIKYDNKNNCIWADTKSGRLKSIKFVKGKIKIEDYSNIETYFYSNDRFVFYDGNKLMRFKKNKFVQINEKPFNLVQGANIEAVDFDDNRLAYVQNQFPNLLVSLYDGNYYSYGKLLKSLHDKLIKDYEFIQIYNDELRIATERGVMSFRVEDSKQTDSPITVISKIIIDKKNNVTDTLFYPYIFNEINIENNFKNILFRFGINKSSNDLVELRYKLIPLDKSWSEWSVDKLAKEYTGLKGGNYKFVLQSRLNGGEIKQNHILINVDKIWYQTNWILVPIFIAFLLVILITIAVMTRISNIKFQKKQKAYKAKMAIKTIDLKNEKLLQYVEVINNKNEFLNEIKGGLERMKNAEAKRWVNKIDDEINNEKKNFLFHKLFSELHQDFIVRLTKKHNNLTSNDIRIISFIRITLGNREIANLMNISRKSVDVARYRLRKKFKLPHETDLDKYIREL